MTCDHRILSGIIRTQNFAREATVVKDRTIRSMISSLLRHLQIPERRRHPSPIVTEAVFGCGNWMIATR